MNDQKLVDALERIASLYDDTSAIGIADDALWDYKKEGYHAGNKHQITDTK